MKVYELCRCEEYFMQESHGLFATAERAVRACAEQANVMLRKDEGTTVYLVTVDPDHYTKPRTDVVLARRTDGGSGDVVVTLDNLDNYLQSFEFYDLEHRGYGVWGVYEREVIE